jgi:hypothetical protein
MLFILVRIFVKSDFNSRKKLMKKPENSRVNEDSLNSRPYEKLLKIYLYVEIHSSYCVHEYYQPINAGEQHARENNQTADKAR